MICRIDLYLKLPLPCRCDCSCDDGGCPESCPLENLIRLGLPNLRICVTSRPEIDIKMALEKLPHGSVSLHDEIGQKKDISEYVRSVVYSDKKMWRLRDEEKRLVIEELSNKADGM